MLRYNHLVITLRPQKLTRNDPTSLIKYSLVMSEIPVDDRVLDDRTLVRGVIYCIEHTESGKQYIGQTVTHRLNKGKYRPYGIRRRFAEHVSNALQNTKPTQSSALYNAIREHKPDAFTIAELERCEIGALDDRERYWIDQHSTQHPLGFNLTTGGARAFQMVATVPIPPLNQPRARGGCSHRTAETRARMAVGNRAALENPEARAQRSEAAASQHNAQKTARFAGVKVDQTNLDQYLTVRQKCILVRVDGREARFASKLETREQLIDRAKQFLMTLTPIQSSTE